MDRTGKWECFGLQGNGSTSDKCTKVQILPSFHAPTKRRRLRGRQLALVLGTVRSYFVNVHHRTSFPKVQNDADSNLCVPCNCCVFTLLAVL